MNKVFAIIKNNIVENAIVAEAYVIAQALLPDEILIEVNKNTGPCYIGGIFEDGIFWPVKEYPSWQKDYAKKIFVAPVPEPEAPLGFYSEWNEDLLDWELKEIPGFKEEV